MNQYGFRASIDLVEEYLDERTSPRWGGLSGRGLKAHQKSGVRAAADEFARGGKSRGNRAHFKVALEGSGVSPTVAADISASA